MSCRHGLLGDRPKQGRFDRGQAESCLDCRQARWCAKGRRLGWPQSGCRLVPLEVALRDERFRKGGRNRRQLDGQGGAVERSDGEERDEP
jgi:hypothetical protein